MKKVTLSLDSSLKEIFTYEESRAVFDKFLPGMRTMAESQPAALGFSVRKIIQFSGGAIPDEAADALDAALCALELYKMCIRDRFTNRFTNIAGKSTRKYGKI